MQMNTVAKSLVVAFCAILPLFCTGCGNITRDDVLGKYLANHGKGLDEIEIKPDGTYFHACKLHDGSSTENSNQWNLHFEKDKPRITFSNFRFCFPPYSKTPPGFWDVDIDRSLMGSLRLDIDSDVHYYYKKQ
jgi:hypothetical protein